MNTIQSKWGVLSACICLIAACSDGTDGAGTAGQAAVSGKAGAAAVSGTSGTSDGAYAAGTSAAAGRTGGDHAGSSAAAHGGGSGGGAASVDQNNDNDDAGTLPKPETDAGVDPQPVGEVKTLHETIVVKAGETFDGKGQGYRAGSELGDGSQSESQKPLFKLEFGATLKNVKLMNPAADGVHCHGDATLSNIVWDDIGEDALTIKDPGVVRLDGGSAQNGDDKVFQINAESTFIVSNFRAQNAGKFIRQNGGTKFKVVVEIDRCDISEMSEAIFRTDSGSSTVKMTDTRYSQIGKELFMGLTSDRITSTGNTEY